MKKLAGIIGVCAFVVALAMMATACSGDMKSSKTDGKKEMKGITILVDPGHGDTDVGTIGVTTGRYEKEVNLEISLKLRDALEKQGVNVVMTRETDEPLGDSNEEDTAKRKEADMQKREEIIEGANANLLISIHQNRFDDSQAKNPQVFYLRNESDGKEYGVDFAQAIQKSINEDLEIENPRKINFGIWRLLKKGNQPGCIVECGFFSNPEEEKLLQTDEYQDKLVDAIVHGVEKYVSEFGV